MRSFIIFLLLSCASWVLAQKKDLPEIIFSKEAGFYTSSIEVKLSANYKNFLIYFTTDGSSPSSRSRLYKKAISISESTVVRAIIYVDKKKGKASTNTYFIGKQPRFPVLSIAVQPKRLFDKEKGLFEKGPNAEEEIPYYGANFWKRKEVQVHHEFFETDGTRVFADKMGFRIFGGMSRMWPQKSFSLYARKRYGSKRIRHQVFPDQPIKAYKHLVLRNSGSDFGKSHFKDGFLTSVGAELGLEVQAYRPAIVYINGKYWGIYNIREKVNKHFVEAHGNVDKDSIDLIEHRKIVKNGNIRHYKRMQKYMRKHSLKKRRHFEVIERLMDIENFMHFQIFQIYIDNQDAGGNIKFWRPQRKRGKWRWILYDTDWGFGLQSENAYKTNSLQFHTAPKGPAWPNPPWSTFNLRRLLTYKPFEIAFARRFADCINTIFLPERLIKRIELMEENLDPEIDRHIERWNLTKANWEKTIITMKTFAKKRPEYMWKFLSQQFKLGQTVDVKISVEGKGFLMLNDFIRIDSKFKGTYFEKTPLDLLARPYEGYQFSHWEGIDTVEANNTRVRLKKGTNTLKAVFKKENHPLTGKLVVTEICANNKRTGDWVEVFNTTPGKLQLSGWKLQGDKDVFDLPDLEIAPGAYFIICEDTARFKAFYNDSIPRDLVGNLSFGLNKKGETIQLLSQKWASIDSVSYVMSKADSPFTLELKKPFWNNTKMKNWNKSLGKGSPGEHNPSYANFSISQSHSTSTLYYIGLLLTGFLLTVSIFLGYKSYAK